MTTKVISLNRSEAYHLSIAAYSLMKEYKDLIKSEPKTYEHLNETVAELDSLERRLTAHYKSLPQDLS